MSLSSGVPRYDPAIPVAIFGTNSYKQIALNAKDDNIITSPFSITLALILAYAGSDGQTKANIEKTLNTKGYSKEEVLQGYSHAVKRLTEAQGANAPYRLNIANNAYVDKTFQLKDQYVNDVKKYLGVTPSAEDFKRDAEGVRNKINKWAANATEDKIKDPLSQGSLGPDTALVLVNAIYFKSEWDQKFKRSDTMTWEFNNLGGQKSNVKMMFRTGSFSYNHDKEAGYQYISIEHKDKRNALMVVMPDEGRDFKQFEQSLTVDFFQNAARGAKMQQVKLGLPQFKFTQEYDLKKTLSSLGMGDAFENGANFSGISQVPVKISKAVHKAFIDVNEDGTEAAAFTGLVMVPYSMQYDPEDVIKMICDRPFVFAIRNDDRGLLLFTGRVTKLENAPEERI